MTKKVLIADKLPDICERILREKGIEVVTKTGLSKEQLIEEIKEYNGLIVRSATTATADVINAAANLEIIARAGAGVDNIDVEAATKKGIGVVNTPGTNSISVKEDIFGKILALSRNLVKYHRSTINLNWDKGKYTITELNNKTLGVLGLGNVGNKVAELATSFGMRVIYHDPYIKSHYEHKPKLEELFKEADIITIHASLNDETRGKVTYDLLSKMKKNAMFINTSRAKIVEGDALLKILKERDDIKIGLDVFYNEKNKEKLKEEIRKFEEYQDRVIVTPHIGGSSEESEIRSAESIGEQIVNLFKTGRAPFILNIKKLDPEHLPYMELVEKLAYLGCNIIETKPNKIEITCYSELDKSRDAFLNRALMPVLRYKSDLFVNEINAAYLAKERGIETKVREPDPDRSKKYGNAITLDLIVNGKDGISIRGIMDEGKVRFMRIGEYKGLSLVGEGKQLMLMYDGSHGILGAIGDVLASYELSAVFMNSGKYEEIGRELSFLTLETDKLLDNEQLEEIKKEILERSGKMATMRNRTYRAIQENVRVYQVKHLDFDRLS